MPTRSTNSHMDDKRKDHIDPEGPSQRNRPKQIHTHNLPTYDVKNITAQIREEINYSLESRRLFPEEQKGCRKRSSHRTAHPQREQSQTEKSSCGLEWQQKSIWYGSALLDNRLPQNVQNIRWSHNLYRQKPWKPRKWNWLQEGKAWLKRRSIQRGIFQGDAIWPLLFNIAMIPLNLIQT